MRDFTDEQCLDIAVSMIANQVTNGITGLNPTDIEKYNYSFFLRENKEEQKKQIANMIEVFKRALNELEKE